MFTAKSTISSPSPSSMASRGSDTFFQPKLNVGKPGDSYEVEADSAADQIVAKSNAVSMPFFPAAPAIQQQSEEDVQRQDAHETALHQGLVVAPITPGVQLKETDSVQKVDEEDLQQQEESGQGEEELQMATDEDTVQQIPEDTVTSKGNPEVRPTLPILQKIATEEIQTLEDEGVQEKEEEDLQQKEDSGQGEEELQMMADEESVQQVPEKTLQSKETPDVTPTLPIVQKTATEEIQTLEEEEVQEKEEEEVQTLQKQATGDDDGTSSIERDLNNSKGGGRPLDNSTKAEMESGFGADFGGVSIHNDSNAVQMNRQLGAQAFTSGNDIYFNEGKYNPESDSGKHLLAHELTHTVQQGASDTKSVQKTEDAIPDPTRPTSPIDISQHLDLTEEWATYLDVAYSEGERSFNLDVNIGESYSGVIKIKKKRGTPEGEPSTYELARGTARYLEISGWNFLNPLREAGVTPILVLREFGESQETTGFLSVKTGDTPLVNDVQGFIRGINEHLEAMSFLGIEPLDVDGLENTFESGRLVFQVSELSTVVDGYLEASGGLGITGETFTFNLDASVDVAGLANGEFTIARGEDGNLSGTGEIQADIGNVQATIHVEYVEGLVTIQGTGQMNSEKFSGEITLLVTDEARSTQMMQAALGVETMDAAAEDSASSGASAPKTRNNQVLAGWGEIQATITPWLEGTAKIGIDNEGHVTIIGEILVPDEIELMEQRGKKVSLFDVEIRAGYGIPLVGQVFLFANIGMFVNAGFGPLVLKDVGFTGTYSTDPSVLQQFSITGTLGINAFAIIGLEAEAGVGVTLLGHDLKAGVNVTAAAGLRAYAEATPIFEYSESQAPEGGKVGESHLKGHFEAAAQLFLQLTGALFYELDSPWWSPAPDGREEFPLGEVQYPIGDTLGIGADIDWLVGSPDAPELTFSPVEFDTDKFTADVMADPPPRTMGDADAEPEGAWTGEPGSEQSENPEITGDGEGLPPNSSREEDLRNLPDEQKYMRALNEMSRMEEANPKPTLSVVEAQAQKVKRKYGITKIETRDKQDDQVSLYVEHARENNSRHLLHIPLMSVAERIRLLYAAMEALQAGSQNAADEDGKITRTDAEQVLTTLKRNHPIIVEARVVEGENTWDYFIDVGDQEKIETGKTKRESEIEEVIEGKNENGLELSAVESTFSDEDEESHRLYINIQGNNTTIMMASTNPDDLHNKIDKEQTIDDNDTPEQELQLSRADRLRAELVSFIESYLSTSEEQGVENITLEIQTKLNTIRDAVVAGGIDSDNKLPETEVTHGMQGGKAKFVKAYPLTNESGNTTGSDPSQDPMGWAHVRSFDLGVDKNGVVKVMNWRRFHLLHNLKMHGPGVAWNLVPTDGTDNGRYYSAIESRMVNELTNNENGIYSFEVTVKKYRDEEPETDYMANFPESLTIQAEELQKGEGNSFTTKRVIFSNVNFDMNIKPKPSRSPGDAQSVIISEAGGENLRTYTSLTEGATLVAGISAATVSSLTSQIVEPSSDRNNYLIRLGYLRSIRESIGNFTNSDGEVEARVFLFSENDSSSVKSALTRKINHYQSLADNNSKITLSTEYNRVKQIQPAGEIKIDITARFGITARTFERYVSGTIQPNPIVTRDITNHLRTL